MARPLHVEVCNRKLVTARVRSARISKNSVFLCVGVHFDLMLVHRGSGLTVQVSASDCFEFRICFKGPKNKIYVFFYSGPFSYLGDEATLQSSYEIQNCVE